MGLEMGTMVIPMPTRLSIKPLIDPPRGYPPCAQRTPGTCYNCSIAGYYISLSAHILINNDPSILTSNAEFTILKFC